MSSVQTNERINVDIQTKNIMILSMASILYVCVCVQDQVTSLVKNDGLMGWNRGQHMLLPFSAVHHFYIIWI